MNLPHWHSPFNLDVSENSDVCTEKSPVSAQIDVEVLNYIFLYPCEVLNGVAQLLCVFPHVHETPGLIPVGEWHILTSVSLYDYDMI
jgi:hypothetical protein